MKFNAFKEEDLPMMTIQKQINRRPPISSYFVRTESEAKKQTGRYPKDVRERWAEPIPPFHEQFKLHWEDEKTETPSK